MDEGLREKLISDGREDLVEVFDINDSGYAGILPNGNIVSRLEYPKAIPIQENSLLRIPKAKKLREEMETDYCCVDCGKYFLTPEELAGEGGAHTAHKSECGVCGKEDMVLHVRHYHWLKHFKYKPKNNKKDE